MTRNDTPAALNATQYAKVKQLFADAIQLSVPKRLEFVERHCQGDDAVRQEVLSLLQHHLAETVLEPVAKRSTTQLSKTQVIKTDESPKPAIVVAPPTQPDSFLIKSDVWEDNCQVLRRRLLVIAGVMACFIALSMIRLMTYHFASVGYGARIFTLCIILGSGWRLKSNNRLSLRELRTIELLVMASMGVLLVAIYARLLLDAAHREVASAAISVDNWNHFAWALMILVYGIFMPNTWQRATAVLLPVVAIPSITTRLCEWVDPELTTLLAADDFGQPIPLVLIAALIAIYAAHLIHGARLSAFHARRLAQYKILRLIGEGGMGQVFEAEHLLLKRACAIKLIQPERAVDDRALARFQQEVRALAKLTHPHTIEVYDYGQTKDGVFFFAMELLPGRNLAELVKESGPMPAERAVHFVTQVCEALVEAHGAGLIHRDIKPANIFASQRGGMFDFTKLLDFGVVRQINREGEDAAVASRVAGTPDYMSPEQIMMPDSVDQRSDLYSLGVVLYFLLTNRTPFETESSLDVLLAHANQIPTRPSVYRTTIPADVEAIVMRCLEKAPSDRFQTAAELRDHLMNCDCAGKWTAEDAARWWETSVPPT
ncbi:serine/threonine-protein kinase [Novipirellula artificiosorum]|uniref:non-specific serine/threonine protein kinase n=1 Tax=Novipirellula artificiosorum TaxID=2528016 RepID=A0A5C6DWR4_9BACT|nr:serine/threonine-protein kinase [Novipirellula artificiosorum]TWU39249.1 Serine/threonine-protein kinase PknB [Novipirellula artificiosorum]